MRKLLAIILTLSLVFAFGLSGCGEQPEPDATAPGHFVLAGEYTDGNINGNLISDDAEVLVWNAESEEFAAGELSEETVVGNL
jgi:hypothetical protein